MILVIGDIVTDVLALISGGVAHASDTPARITMAGGGAGANTAAWLAAAGAPVSLVGVVGVDSAGAARLAELAAAGVRLLVRKDSAAPTGAIVVIGDARERTFLTDRGANLRLSPVDIDAALASGGQHLHLSGYELLDAASRPAGLHALRAAATAGLTTSVDAASAAPLRRIGGATFLSWVAGTDLLLANIDEATALLDAPTGDGRASGAAASDGGCEGRSHADDLSAAGALAEALAERVGRVVVKAGAAGAVWTDDRGTVTVPGEPVAAVDATGAGDAFAAGLLIAWLDGGRPQDCLRAGAALGARAVAHPGARPIT